MRTAQTRRSIGALVLGNVLGGVGVASGVAVGSLLVASMSSEAWAGVGQALSVLGAGLLAVPLARLAAHAGRRRALTLGYAIALIGALIVLLAATLGLFWLLLVGLLGFGAAQTTTLQTRYAASELADPARRGTVMSIVIWATTIGSVTGPNLSAAGARLGERFGIPTLAGPYLFSLAGFLLAALCVAVLFAAQAQPAAAQPGSPADVGPARAISALAALRWAAGHPVARFAVVLLVTAHAVMVGIMSMTPLHLGHQGHSLQVLGVVISLHILGMYALSPVFGWLADKVGPMRTALLGLVVLGAAAGLAFVAAGNLPAVMAALTLLGLGWSAAIISSSVLLTTVDSGAVRVPLQGATDALMNYAGAAAALLAGVLIATIGFGGLAITGLLLVLPAAAVGWIAHRHRRSPGHS